MSNRRQWVWLGLLASSWVLAGCSTPQAVSTIAAKPASLPEPVFTNAPPPLTPEQQEARVEAIARYQTGLSYELRGEGEKALEEYYQSGLADPGNRDVIIEVGRRLLRSKQSAKAITLLNKAAAQPDAPAMVDALLGVAFAQNGKKEQAIEASRSAISKAPASMQGYQNLFSIYSQNEQPKEALAVLDEAAKVSTTDAGFLIDLAELYVSYTRMKPTEAEAVKQRTLNALDAAAALKPASSTLLERMAGAYVATGETQKAADLYVRLLTRFNDQPGIRESLRGRLTELYLRSGDRKRASEQLEAIAKTVPTNPQIYYLLASIAFDAKEHDKAVEYYERTLLLNPKFEQAYYDLAGVRIAQDQAKQALGVLERARTNFPVNFQQEFYAGVVHSRLKDYAAAVKHYTSAELLAKAGDRERLTHIFYFQLGATHERNKDFAQAEKYFQECLKLSPDFAEALNYLGYMWAERGVKLEEAKVMIEKAVKLEPENAAFLDSLGWVLFKLGQPQPALEYIQKSIKLSEKAPDATLFDHLGDIFAALKRNAEAREAWKKSLSIEDSAEVKRKLEANPGT
jgi:tetratricopeptide (TPR) repeat protein